MAYPRRLLPGQTHATSRRVAHRRHLLRPDEFTNQVVKYSIGRACQLNPTVRLHAFVAESNHTHTNLTDGRADDAEVSEIPSFFQCMHRLIAAALNARYKPKENFWSPGSYSNVEVHGEVSKEQQLLYLWTNPVKDGLVERPEDWPGVIFLPEDFGTTLRVQKPEGAFFGGRRPDAFADPKTSDDWRAELLREEDQALALLGSRGHTPPRARRNRSKLPEFVEIKIEPPPGYEDWPIEEVRAHFRKVLDAEVERIHAQRKAQGKTQFLGQQAVLDQDPYEVAGDVFPTFKRNPRIACRGDKVERMRQLVGLQEWRAAYRLAFEANDRGRDVAFPRGTYAWGCVRGIRVRRWTAPPTGPPRSARSAA